MFAQGLNACRFYAAVKCHIRCQTLFEGIGLRFFLFLFVLFVLTVIVLYVLGSGQEPETRLIEQEIDLESQ